jgi:hydrogenase small subunit
LNSVYPDIAKVLTEIISLEYHATVMASAGDQALEILDQAIEKGAGKFFLVVEGSIPTGSGGAFSTMGERNGAPIPVLDWTMRLGTAAKAILNVGTCSAFGGIPAGNPNPTGAKAVRDLLPKATMINIPGCPPHPDWIIGTIAHVLLFGIPELDPEKRPTVFFSHLIHENCERRSYFEEGKFASDYSEEGCLIQLGCKGPIAHCDISTRGWNNGVNWCCRSGGPCIACTEPTFPDHEGSGLYGLLDKDSIKHIPWNRDLAQKPKQLAPLG